MIAFQGLRASVALLLCPLLCLQACATAGPLPLPPAAVLSRSAVEDTIEVQADPDTLGHLSEVTRLKDARVIPMSLVIRNLGTSDVIVGSAGITLELSDGRHLPVIQVSAVDERLPKPSAPPPPESPPPAATVTESAPSTSAPTDTAQPGDAPPASPQEQTTEQAPTEQATEQTPTEQSAPPSKAWETTKEVGKMMGGAFLGGMAMYLAAWVVAALVVTSPIWGPPVLISHYVKKKSEKLAASQTLRSSALERLEDVRLARGEATGGLLYFAADGGLPDSLATATLVVPIRQAESGEELQVRLSLGKAD